MALADHALFSGAAVAAAAAFEALERGEAPSFRLTGDSPVELVTPAAWQRDVVGADRTGCHSVLPGLAPNSRRLAVI